MTNATQTTSNTRSATSKRNEFAAAYRQEDGAGAWMGLPGTVTNDGTATNAEMIEQAGLLNWNIRLEEIAPEVVGMDEDGEAVYEEVDVPSFKVMRDKPSTGLPHRLAIVGNRYHEVQNEALIAMADNITGGDATLIAAGQYGNGRRVFLSFMLGDSIVLDPNGSADEIGRHLTVMAGHDGGLGIGFFTHGFRFRCQNQLTSIRLGSMGSFKARHTQNVEGRILEARKALSIGFKATEELEQELIALNSISVDGADGFKALVEKITPRPEKDVKGSLAKWEHKMGTLLTLWDGPTVANLDDTAYKAYNVLNEGLLWYTSVRANNVESALVKASGFDDLTNRKNLDLFKQVLTLAA